MSSERDEIIELAEVSMLPWAERPCTWCINKERLLNTPCIKCRGGGTLGHAYANFLNGGPGRQNRQVVLQTHDTVTISGDVLDDAFMAWMKQLEVRLDDTQSKIKDLENRLDTIGATIDKLRAPGKVELKLPDTFNFKWK